MLYQGKGECAKFGFETDLGFERGLEEFERGQLPSSNAQRLQIQYLDRGGQGYDDRHDRVQDEKQQRHEAVFPRRTASPLCARSISPQGNPSRLRQRTSACAISPESAS